MFQPKPKLMEDQFSDTQIIEKARECLPPASEWENEKIRMSVRLPNSTALDDKFPISYCEVEFQKQIVNGIVCGWEHTGVINKF